MDIKSSENSGRTLLLFFALTYIVAWAFFLAAAKFSGAPVNESPLEGIRWILFLPGVFAPSIVALALTAQAEGSEGVRALLAQLFEWHVGARWFVFAICYTAAIKLAAAVLHRAIEGAWPRFGDTPWYFILGAIVISTPFQAGEEIGWRGYALPRLASRFGFARASLLVGVIWVCWHLPFFFIRGTESYGQPFFLYALQVTALSVAIAWLYLRTNGSLLLPMLMHAAVNNSKDIVPSAIPGAADPFGLRASRMAWLTLALLWICAAYFLARMPKVERQRY